MPVKITRARVPGMSSSFTNGATSVSKKRKAADQGPRPVAHHKKAKAVHASDHERALKGDGFATNDNTKAKARVSASKLEPVFTIQLRTTLADFISSPPNTLTLPIINHPPTTSLDVFGFGTGDMCGELGLGPKLKEAALATLIPKLEGKIKGNYSIGQLDCGGMHTIALTEGGEMIVTWGGNNEGALGRDTSWDGGQREMDAEDEDDGGDHASPTSDDEPLNPFESTPTHIPEGSFAPGTRFTHVAAGDSCSFAVTQTGLVYGWGTFLDTEAKGYFLYYRGEHIHKQLRPVLIPGLKDIKSVVCGSNHALALDSAGRVWSWGLNEKFQVGQRFRPTRLHPQEDPFEHLYPGLVDLSHYPIKYLAAGPFHSLAVDEKDRVFAWGLNHLGQAGYPNNAGEDGAALPFPLQIRSLSHLAGGIQMISAGEQHSAVVTGDGRCHIWGYIDKHNGFVLTEEQMDDPKQVLRDGRNRPRILLRPVAVPNIGEAAYVACSRSHTLFVNTAGRAYAAGFGSELQLGNGTGNDNVVAKLVKGLESVRVIWCGSGGQFSMLAAVAQ